MMTFLNHDGMLTLADAATPWVSNPGILMAILGSAVGVFGGVYGTLVGTLAPRGKAKSLVLSLHWTGVAIGLALMTLSGIALATGQPYGVWYGLGLPGLILTFVILPLTGVVKARYQQAEQRRLEAENFRRG